MPERRGGVQTRPVARASPAYKCFRMATNPDGFGTRGTLEVGGVRYAMHRLDALAGRVDAAAVLAPRAAREPAPARGRTLRDARPRRSGAELGPDDGSPTREIPFMPARVILQDFTGVPCVVDLAAMRDAMQRLGGDPKRINPLQPVDLVIDHSVQVDCFGTRGGVRQERRDRVRAQPRALRVPALGAAGVQRLPRRAARHRHRAPGEPRVPRARRARAGARTARRMLFPTRWSAPTRTPP